MALAESIAPETGAKSTLPAGVDSVALGQQLELVFGGDNSRLARRMRKNEIAMVSEDSLRSRQAVDFLDKYDVGGKAQTTIEIIGPAIFSGGLWETMPQLHRVLESFVVGGTIGGFFSEGLLGAMSQAERIHPRFARLARSAGILRGMGFKIAQISASAGIGIVTAEGLDRWLQVQTQAAAQPAMTGGGEGFNNPHPGHRPVEASASQVGGLPLDDRGAGAIVSPPAELPGQAGNLPGGGESGSLPPGDLLPQPGDAELLAQQAAEAARIAALQQGPTVAELAANMPKQTVSEAIYQMIGDVPHRGEVTNILFRAIGDKVGSLNEGAIKAMAEALRPVFNNIDKTVAGSGVPYTEGGRAAVEAMRGFNSPEAQAIRAANLGDLEAASNLLNNVIEPVITVIK